MQCATVHCTVVRYNGRSISVDRKAISAVFHCQSMIQVRFSEPIKLLLRRLLVCYSHPRNNIYVKYIFMSGTRKHTDFVDPVYPIATPLTTLCIVLADWTYMTQDSVVVLDMRGHVTYRTSGCICHRQRCQLMWRQRLVPNGSPNTSTGVLAVSGVPGTACSCSSWWLPSRVRW